MTACLMCPSCAEPRDLARRSADAAVQCARELGAVASAEVAARDALALAAGRYLDAVAAREAAEAAHTNAASGGALRYAAMDALTRARGAETTAAGALARALGRV